MQQRRFSMTTASGQDTGRRTQYVMFENAGAADFYALFLVGFTDKVDDPASIGMFGSGFKLAVTSALRQGIDIILYLGRTKVTFRTARREVKGETVEQLVFQTQEPDGEVQEFQTNLTLGYGARDWKGAWGVFREILANCRDADPRRYEVVAGVEPKGREGFTRVFVEATEDIRAIYRDLDRYFRDERHAMFVCEAGRVYPKASPEGSTWFYCKGMFVLEMKLPSRFDIDLYDMPINESRNASTEDLACHVLRLYDDCPAAIQMDVIQHVIRESHRGANTLEGSLYWTQTRRPAAWADAFRRAFPDHVLCSHSELEFQGMIRLGRKPVRVGLELYRMLSSAGIVTAEQVLREEQECTRQAFELDEDMKRTYDEAFAAVSSKLPEVNMLDISFIRVPPEDANVSFVSASRARGQFQFTDRLLRSGRRAVGLALIDALAQSRSVSGKCDMDYENELIRIAWQCLGQES